MSVATEADERRVRIPLREDEILCLACVGGAAKSTEAPTFLAVVLEDEGEGDSAEPNPPLGLGLSSAIAKLCQRREKGVSLLVWGFVDGWWTTW